MASRSPTRGATTTTSGTTGSRTATATPTVWKPTPSAAQLARHDVRILLGAADTTSASLDQSCGANLQGPRRYHRGRTLVRFMDELYAGHAHREMIVPGVGHSSRSMWLSGVGAGALFGN